MPRTTAHAAPPAGPVTPKGAATRAFILQTAAEVFSERGYAETTLSELIARSGMAKGAFYFHFRSKEDLALAVLEEKQHQWQEFVRARVLAQDRAIEQLRALAPAIAELHRHDPSAFSAARLIRDLRRMPELAEGVAAPSTTATSRGTSTRTQPRRCSSRPPTASRTSPTSSTHRRAPGAASSAGWTRSSRCSRP